MKMTPEAAHRVHALAKAGNGFALIYLNDAERRVQAIPWKRPRVTDLKTGERTYKERRKRR